MLYPADITVAPSAQFNRVHVGVRIVVLVILSFAGISLGALGFAIYLLLPIAATIAIAERGSERFLNEDAPRFARALGWLFELLGYAYLLTDRLPGHEEPKVHFSVSPGGVPTPGRALVRLVTSIPSALVLAILHLVAWIIWLVSALLVLITTTYPRALFDVQCGILRWQARLFAYHASVIDAYPPFALDLGGATSDTGVAHAV